MKKLIYGILILLGAILIVLTSAGVNIAVIESFSVIEIALTVVLVAMTVCIAIDGAWQAIPGTLFLMFLYLEDNIAIWCGKAETDFISNWIVAACAVCASIGIGLISSSVKKSIFKKRLRKGYSKNTGNAYNATFESGNSHSAKFSSETKYVDCSKYKKYLYSVNMGDAKIYYENTDSYEGGGELILNCSMGNIMVYIPKNWRVNNNIKTNLGNTTIRGLFDESGPELNVSGTNSMGNIEIIGI